MVPPASDKIPRVSPYSGSHSSSGQLRLQGLHLLRLGFQSHSAAILRDFPWSFNPGPRTGLGFSPFARRYSGNHCCFLFLRVLRCFSSPGTSHEPMYSAHDDSSSSCRVPPFGYRRVFASLQLAGAFRSLARPSSVSSGKASSVRPSLLNQWFSSFFLLSRVFTRCFIKNCFFTVFSVLSSTFV